MILELVEVVQKAWGWTGIEAVAVTAISAFGHLVIRDRRGAFWYLDPEIRSLNCIAENDSELFAYMNKEGVKEVWQAAPLVVAARERLGEPGDRQCYSLKAMALLEGDYAHENLCIITITELILFTGDFEQQTRHMQDGSQVRLKVVD